MTKTSYRSACSARGPRPPQLKFNDLFNQHFPWLIFRGGVLEDVETSPRGRQILKSLALASRPQVLENWPVLGSRTARFFGMLKFCGALEKFFGKRFLVEIAWKIFVKSFFFFFFFFLESTCALCPWSLALASSIPVLGLESVCPRKGCPWPWPRIFFVSLALALASSLVSSTPPLLIFFKSILCVKTGEVEVNYWIVIEK